MNSLHKFYNKNIKLNFINKFHCTDLKNLPKFRKIVLNSSCKTTELKVLATNLLALKFVTSQQGKLTTAKKPNILFKVRKGNPLGSKLTLTKNIMFSFLLQLITEIFTKTKNRSKITVLQKVTKKTSFDFMLKNPLQFFELSKHYTLFKNLAAINLAFIISTKAEKKLVFFLRSFKIPIK